jgi:hypothetical protein
MHLLFGATHSLASIATRRHAWWPTLCAKQLEARPRVGRSLSQAPGSSTNLLIYQHSSYLHATFIHATALAALNRPMTPPTKVKGAKRRRVGVCQSLVSARALKACITVARVLPSFHVAPPRALLLRRMGAPLHSARCPRCHRLHKVYEYTLGWAETHPRCVPRKAHVSV